MADFTALKTAIQTYVKQNGNEEITGDILQGILLSIVTTLGDNAINNLQETVDSISSLLENGAVYCGIATPSTNPGTPTTKVFYIALQAGTYTNFGNLSVVNGVTILSFNGSTWSKQLLSYGDGVFDISEYKATGGTLATFTDLAAAIGTDGANVPVEVRKGGMSVKFVQSSDNKYVQARCMAQNFTTDTTQWQGVDATPVPASKNLIESGAVEKVVSQIGDKYELEEITMTTGGYIQDNGTTVDINTVTPHNSFKYGVVDCQQGDVFLISGNGASAGRLWCFIDSSSNIIENERENVSAEGLVKVAPPNSSKLIINSNVSSNGVSYKGKSVSVFTDEAETAMLMSSGMFGEKLSIIGDSISSINEKGYKYGDYPTYYPNAGINNHEKMYWGLLMKITNLKMEVNASYAGSGATPISSAPTFYSRVALLGNPDTIIVALGTNDSIQHKTIGDIDYNAETASLSETTFGTAYLKGIKGLLAAYPDAKIICIAAEMEDAYANAISNIASHYGIDFIDARGYTSGVDGQGHDLAPHPGILGMKQIAARIVDNSRKLDSELDANGNYILKAGGRVLGGYASSSNMQNATDNIGVIDIPITTGGYIATNGTTVDVTDINSGNTWGYAVVDCVEGDVFSITAKAGSTPRCWCFIDSLGNNLGHCYIDKLCNEDMIVAPKNTAKLVCNFDITQNHKLTHNVKGSKLQKDVYSHINSELHKIDNYYVVKAYIDSSGKWGYVNNAGTTTYLVPVKEGDGIYVNAPISSSYYFGLLRYLPIYITAGGNVPFSEYDGYDTVFNPSVGARYLKVPADAKYLAVTTEINGTNRSPEHVVINGYDIITGERADNKIHGGTYGGFNTTLTKASKLIITLIDDDAQNVASMNALKQLCADNSIKCTIASVTSKWENDNTLLNKLYEMEEAGHHIVLHAHEQDDTPGSNQWSDFDSRVDHYTQNFVIGLRQMYKAGFLNCNFWPTPSGIYSDKAQALAKKYGMKALIAGHIGINLNTATDAIFAADADNSKPLTPRDCRRWNLMRVNFPFNDTTIQGWDMNKIKNITARGVNHGAWIILTSHSYQWIEDPSAFPDYATRFAEYVEYAQGLGYEFMTLGEAWEYKKYIYDLSDTE